MRGDLGLVVVMAANSGIIASGSSVRLLRSKGGGTGRIFRLTLRSLGSSGEGEWEGWWWRGSASMLAPRSGDMRSSSSVMLMLIVVAPRVAERRGDRAVW